MRPATNANPAARTANHPPLAHNGHGQPVPVPDGTAGWLVKRATAGRPRAVVGPDRQPVRLPVDTTQQELAEMFGAGTYRIEACDEVGELIDLVATVSVGNAGEGIEAGAMSAAPRNAAIGPGGELRVALDVIHQLARTNGDALRAVAEAQADYVKSLASAKLIPRNGIVAIAPVTPSRPPETDERDDDSGEHDDADDGGDGDGDESEDGEVEVVPAKSSPASQLEALAASAALALAPKLIDIVQGFLANPSKLMEILDWRRIVPKTATAAPSAASPAASIGPDPTMHLVRIRNGLTYEERGLLDEIMREEEVAMVILRGMATLDVEEAIARLRAEMAPRTVRREVPPASRPPISTPAAAPASGDLMAQVMAVRALLEPSEILAVMTLLPGMPAEQREAIEATLLAMSPADAAAWIRANLPELSKRGAS